MMMARRRAPIALAAATVALLALLAAPVSAQQHRRAASLFSRMKQQKAGEEGEAEPVAAAEPEEGGIRFERRKLALDETPGFASAFDEDLQMIK